MSEGNLQGNIHADTMAKVESFTSLGQWRAALELLMAENARQPNSIMERKMVDLRIRASDWPVPNITWPPHHHKLRVQGYELPEVTRKALNIDTLRSGMLGNGGLIVRGLMDKTLINSMRKNIDHTLLARLGGDGEKDGVDRLSWYTRSPQVKGGPAQFFALGGAKQSASASVWAVDSPRTANQLIQFYNSIELPALLHAYFSEPAALSVKKWVLRRVAPDNGSKSGWHQDGRFLGEDIRTVNLWIALTECGGDAKAPGMDIVGGRNSIIYQTGTHGAPFDWTVGQGLVDGLGCDQPVLSPKFYPGDALFFDHYNLHRTGFGLDDTQDRYALESWFFAASSAPAKQMPVFF